MDKAETAFDRAVADDAVALREIFATLDRLEAAFDGAREAMSPRRRGYFTPDEDDQVRRLLLVYRNVRAALYEIVGRYRGFLREPDERARLRGFIVGFAAALRLYRKSLKLVEAAEEDEFLRAKLNEPDARFGLDSGFFEAVLGGCASLRNYWAIGRAAAWWAAYRRRAAHLCIADDRDVGWLVSGIAGDRHYARNLFWLIIVRRFRQDIRLGWRTLFAPIDVARYGSQSLVGTLLSQLRVPLHRHAIDGDVLDLLGAELMPGDVLLVRAEDKVTCALLPGFWAHAAIFLGDAERLAELNLPESPAVAKALALMRRRSNRHGYVAEAIPRGVRISALQTCLRADHVAVMRPRLAPAELAGALADALGHLGKPYDFEFDFNVSTRIVCTELVYRAYHGRGAIAFDLVKRLGRWTLTADDLANQTGKPDGEHAALKIVALWGPGPEGRAVRRDPATAQVWT